MAPQLINHLGQEYERNNNGTNNAWTYCPECNEYRWFLHYSDVTGFHSIYVCEKCGHKDE